jgi:hypothetical protein
MAADSYNSFYCDMKMNSYCSLWNSKLSVLLSTGVRIVKLTHEVTCWEVFLCGEDNLLGLVSWFLFLQLVIVCPGSLWTAREVFKGSHGRLIIVFFIADLVPGLHLRESARHSSVAAAIIDTLLSPFPTCSAISWCPLAAKLALLERFINGSFQCFLTFQLLHFQ